MSNQRDSRASAARRRKLMIKARPAIFGLVLLFLAAVTTACAGRTRPEVSPSHIESAATPILEFAAEPAHGEDVQVTTYEHGDQLLRLGPRRSFRIIEARVSPDNFGYPGLLFTVAPEEKEAFRKYTADHVGRRLAILVDGKIVTAPYVNSELPGTGMIESGAQRWTEKEVADLAARLLAGREAARR